MAAAAAAAAATWAGPVEGDGCEATVEAESTNMETVTGQAEEGQPATEVPQASEQQSADGKSKPASEKIWGSFLKNSGLGKVMGGRKKKEQAGSVDGGEGMEQEKSPSHGQSAQGEGQSPPSSPKEQSASAGGAGSLEQCIEKEPEGEETTQEQKPSSKDAKPKQGVRDFIRKPVSRIFSHRSTEKKDFGAEAPKRGKTRSKSLDRLEDAEVCPAETDQTDESQAAGEQQKSAPHSAKHMKRWHSFKKLMAQKSLKKSTEDPKDVESAEGPGSDTQIESETLESGAKLDHTGQKRWKLKRSWTFQGLKRDPSVIGIHKAKGSDRDFSDNLKGEEAPADVDQGATATTEEPKALGEGEATEKACAEEDKGQAAQRTKSVDHHANEIWTSFKKRVIPKSKRAGDASASAGGGGGGEEEQAGEHDQVEEQAGREHGKSAKTKRTHFNRAVSLKNFIMRKGKGTSVDLGEGPAGQKEEAGEGADTGSPGGEDAKESEGPADQAGAGASEGLAAVQNGGDNPAEAVGANGEEQQPDAETTCPEAKEETQAEPASGPTCGEKTHGENGSSTTGCDGKASATEGKEEKAEEIIAQDHETAPQEDGPQEKAKQEDVNSQEAAHQTENACTGSSKDEKNLNQEQCSEKKCSSGNPVAQSGECTAENDCYDLQQTGGDVVVLDTSFELEPILDGPPQNGGAHPGSVKTNTEPNDQEEDQKRMFYEAAASIVQTVVSAATKQLAKEKDLLDNGFKGSYHNNNDNYPDLDVNYCH